MQYVKSTFNPNSNPDLGTLVTYIPVSDGPSIRVTVGLATGPWDVLLGSTQVSEHTSREAAETAAQALAEAVGDIVYEIPTT